MASTVEEFRRYNVTPFTLPSGLEVELLRKPQSSIFLGLGELPVPATREPHHESILSQEEIISLSRYTDRAIARSVLMPAMTDDRDREGRPILHPDRLHVSELDQEDYSALANTILVRMGLVKEEADVIESFRPDAVGTPGEGTREGISSLAFTGTPANAR